MDLSFFDKLIKETDNFISDLSSEAKRRLGNNITRYKNFKEDLNLDKRTFGDYESSLKYFDTLAKKTKSDRKRTFESIISNAKHQLDYTKNNYWHGRWREDRYLEKHEELREELVEALEFFENFYEQFADGLKSFKGELFEMKNNRKKIIRLTEGDLIKLIKRVINESNDFANQDNVDKVLDKINKTGVGSLSDIDKRVLDNPDKYIDIDDEEEEVDIELHRGSEDVQTVVKALINFGWINPNKIEIYEDYFEISDIVGEDFDYFYEGNRLVFTVHESNNGVIEVDISGEDFGNEDYSDLSDDGEDFDFSDEDDNENRAEVINYIIDNWADDLSEEGIEVFADSDSL